MLPLIPALLLILMHGPAGVDRMGPDARLPEALKLLAVSTENDPEAEPQPSLDEQERRVQVLLSLGRPTQELRELLVQVWAQYLTPVPHAAVELTQVPDASPPPNREAALGELRDGHFRTIRSRDGPSA